MTSRLVQAPHGAFFFYVVEDDVELAVGTGRPNRSTGAVELSWIDHDGIGESRVLPPFATIGADAEDGAPINAGVPPRRTLEVFREAWATFGEKRLRDRKLW